MTEEQYKQRIMEVKEEGAESEAFYAGEIAKLLDMLKDERTRIRDLEERLQAICSEHEAVKMQALEYMHRYYQVQQEYDSLKEKFHQDYCDLLVRMNQREH